jgi:hypothetical protein
MQIIIFAHVFAKFSHAPALPRLSGIKCGDVIGWELGLPKSIC